jgi:DNA (cytosine-5)-methyltransferase 1
MLQRHVATVDVGESKHMSNRKIKQSTPRVQPAPLEAYCAARGLDRDAFVEHLVAEYLARDFDPEIEPYRLRRPLGALAPLTAVDLFSGAGGITLGLANASFNVIFCADFDKACAATHQRNFPDIPFKAMDIGKLDGADIRKATGLRKGQLDLLIGGPPCQGYSIIGPRDDDDPRNFLFKQFLCIAKDLQPKCVVIENVSGLATLGKGAMLGQIGEAFTEIGYDVDCAELVAAQYGVPQLRWRMFFIGWRRDLNRRGGFPTPSHGRTSIGDLVPNRTLKPHETAGFLTVFDAIGDLPPIGSGERGHAYMTAPTTPFQRAMRAETDTTLHNHYAPKLSKKNLDRIEHLKPGDDWRSLPHHLLPAGMQRALRKDHTRRFRRMQWDGVARSIITRFRDPKSGEYIHPDQTRTISIREAARIQSFPDWFVFEGSNTEQYDQVGNAVPPLLAKSLGRELARMLTSKTAEKRPPVKSRYQIPAPSFLVAAE